MVKKHKFIGDVSTEDESVDLSNMFEAQARSVQHLAEKRTLVLNADYQPLSYKPLSTEPWTQIFFWLVKGWGRERDGKPPIISVVEEYDDAVVRASGQTFKLPAIVAHTKMIPMAKSPSFSRSNIYLRDDYTCQYTGVRYPPSELNLDHVIPFSRGGKSNWLNLVTSHKDVNFKKADRTPEEAGLRLIREPYEPNAWELREKGRSYPSELLHESWADYVYFNVKMEQDEN